VLHFVHAALELRKLTAQRSESRADGRKKKTGGAQAATAGMMLWGARRDRDKRLAGSL
jgi:hypothetical protein